MLDSTSQCPMSAVSELSQATNTWGQCLSQGALRTRAADGRSLLGSGKGGDAITSGLEGAWTTSPAVWGSNYFDNLFTHE